MSNLYLDCGLDCRLVWKKLRLIKNKRHLSWLCMSRASCKQLYAKISVDIQGAHRDKALHDDPNESFAVFYYWLLIKYRWRQAVCRTDFSPNQLLPENINDLFLLCRGDFRSRARRWNRSCFTDVHFWTWIDANMGRKMNVCIFCSFITQISFFVIPEICLTASVIHSKLKLITNIDFVVTLGPEAEHSR